MLFHDSSTRRDTYISLFESNEFPLWVDFGKQISLTVHSFQVISTSSKVIIFLHVRNKGKFFLKKRVQMEHGWQAPPSPPSDKGQHGKLQKNAKGGTQKIQVDKGGAYGFFHAFHVLLRMTGGARTIFGGGCTLLPSDVTKIKFQTYLMSNNRLVIQQLLHDVKKTRLFSINL